MRGVVSISKVGKLKQKGPEAFCSHTASQWCSRVNLICLTEKPRSVQGPCSSPPLQVPCLFLAVSTRTRLPVSTPQPVNAGRRGAPHLRVHLLTCSSLLVVDLFGMTHSHFIFSLLSPSPPPSSDLAEEACEEEI